MRERWAILFQGWPLHHRIQKKCFWILDYLSQFHFASEGFCFRFTHQQSPGEPAPREWKDQNKVPSVGNELMGREQGGRKK